MARVLVIGESWFVHSIHQKGFDSFVTSTYEEGGEVFLAALRGHGHDVTYVPAHEIDRRVPSDIDGYAAYDVIVISDVGANSFLLPEQTFTRSIPSPDKTEVIRAHVEQGGAVLMVGGYLTFSGIDAKARWGRSALRDALPVHVLDRDDRVELPAGAAPTVVSAHSIVDGLDATWPSLLGLNEVVAKDDAQVIATCAGYPLLVVGTYGAGRTAAFTSDIAPHWAPPEFLDWDGYGDLFDALVSWLAAS